MSTLRCIISKLLVLWPDLWPITLGHRSRHSVRVIQSICSQNQIQIPFSPLWELEATVLLRGLTVACTAGDLEVTGPWPRPWPRPPPPSLWLWLRVSEVDLGLGLAPLWRLEMLDEVLISVGLCSPAWPRTPPDIRPRFVRPAPFSWLDFLVRNFGTASKFFILKGKWYNDK